MIGEIKYCKFCNKEKPIEEFVKSGFAIKNICRECQNKKQTQIYKDSKKVKELEKENQELKEHLEVGKEQYNDLVEEKENLQEQLDYLRGGEYLNQLRFERDMLQHVVDNSKVSKVDKEFIDMTHRNTKLLEEKQKYKEVIDKLSKTIYEIDELRKTTGGYPSDYIDYSLEILREVE